MAKEWIFSEQELQATPSRAHGYGFVDELVARKDACRFVELLCKRLDLPKLAQISADMFVHRFFMRCSLFEHDRFVVAGACVLLGSKTEECFKKVGSIAREFVTLWKQRTLKDPEDERLQRLPLDKKVAQDQRLFGDVEFVRSKVLSMEALVLHRLAYDLTVQHPYTYINEKVDKVINLQKLLSNQEQKTLTGKMKQVAWSFLNDSAYTCACLRASSQDLASGAVYLAGLYENNVPRHLCTAEGNPWWHELGTDFATLEDAAKHLLEAYTEPYIKTQVLRPGLAKLVYEFHPPRANGTASAVSSPSCLDPNDEQQTLLMEQEAAALVPVTPVDSPCDYVTSPECSSVVGDQDLMEPEAEFKAMTPSSETDTDKMLCLLEESPRETTHAPTASYHSMGNSPFCGPTGSSADKSLQMEHHLAVTYDQGLKRSATQEEAPLSSKRMRCFE